MDRRDFFKLLALCIVITGAPAGAPAIVTARWTGYTPLGELALAHLGYTRVHRIYMTGRVRAAL